MKHYWLVGVRDCAGDVTAFIGADSRSYKPVRLRDRAHAARFKTQQEAYWFAAQLSEETAHRVCVIRVLVKEPCCRCRGTGKEP